MKSCCDELVWDIVFVTVAGFWSFSLILIINSQLRGAPPDTASKTPFSIAGTHLFSVSGRVRLRCLACPDPLRSFVFMMPHFRRSGRGSSEVVRRSFLRALAPFFLHIIVRSPHHLTTGSFVEDQCGKVHTHRCFFLGVSSTAFIRPPCARDLSSQAKVVHRGLLT